MAKQSLKVSKLNLTNTDASLTRRLIDYITKEKNNVTITASDLQSSQDVLAVKINELIESVTKYTEQDYDTILVFGTKAEFDAERAKGNINTGTLIYIREGTGSIFIAGDDDSKNAKLVTQDGLGDAVAAEILKDPTKFKGKDGIDGKDFIVKDLDPSNVLEPADVHFVGISDLLSGTDAGSKILALDKRLTAEDTAMKAKIADLETKEASNASQIAAFGSSTEITQLKTDAATAKADITALKSADTSLLAEINKVKNDAADKTEINAANAEITKLKNDKADKTEITTLDAKITTNTSEIATVKSSINTAQSDATTAKTQSTSNSAKIVSIEGDVATLKVTVNGHTSTIALHTQSIDRLSNIATVTGVYNVVSATPATIKTAAGASQPGTMLFNKVSATTFQIWVADTTNAGEWKHDAGGDITINIEDRSKNPDETHGGVSAKNGIASEENMVIVGSTTDTMPSYVKILDLLKTAFNLTNVDEGKVLTVDASGNLVKKKPESLATDKVLDKDLAEQTTLAIEKGDLLIAESVDGSDMLASIAATTIKPVIAELVPGTKTPVITHANKIAYGGVDSTKIKYLNNPGTDGKVLTSQTTGHALWETPAVSVGTVTANDVAIIEAVDADGKITVGKAGFTKGYVTAMRTELNTAKTDITTNATGISTNATAIATNKTTAEGAKNDLDAFKLQAFGLQPTDSISKPGWPSVLNGKPLTQAEKDKIGNLPDDTNNELSGKQKELPAHTKDALGLNANDTLKVTDTNDPNFIVPFTKSKQDAIGGSVNTKVYNAAGNVVLSTTMDGSDDDKLLITKKLFNDETNGMKVNIGYLTGETNQGSTTVAVGHQSGRTSQGSNAVAVGNVAGEDRQGTYGVAIGHYAGRHQQGSNAIAIGRHAGENNQPAGSIVIANRTAPTNPANTNEILIQTQNARLKLLPNSILEGDGASLKFNNRILANADASNINVGAGNAGKFLKVKTDGHLEYVDPPKGHWQTVNHLTYNFTQTTRIQLEVGWATIEGYVTVLNIGRSYFKGITLMKTGASGFTEIIWQTKTDKVTEIITSKVTSGVEVLYNIDSQPVKSLKVWVE